MYESMYGAFLGDIIGSRFEFNRNEEKNKEGFELFAENCNYTDDSVMTIAIMEALANAGKKADIETIHRKCIESMKKWGTRFPDAGYGGYFRRWLNSNDRNPYNSYGNGSAMRVSGAGWAYDSIERTREVARATAEVTHNHPEGIKGAECTAAIMYLARTGENKKEIRDYVIKEFQYNLSHNLEEYQQPPHKFYVSCQDSLPRAITCFLESFSFEETIRNAVSLGGDTDTIAAIAGAMADAYYGVPDELIEKGKIYLPESISRGIEIYKNFVYN